MTTNKGEEVYLAILAEQANRYEDMVVIMRKIAESSSSELTNEDRNLISVAYKNIVGARRSAWRVISSIEQNAEKYECQRPVAKEYREKIERELKDYCYDILILLDQHLISKSTTTESKIFYLKMKSDYYRYLAEVVIGDEQKKLTEESQRSYTDYVDLIKSQMPAIHPLRLSLALNSSVNYYDILNQPKLAIQLANEAFNDALAELDTVDENFYKESTLLMQLLHDNLILWTNDVHTVTEANYSDEEQ